MNEMPIDKAIKIFKKWDRRTPTERDRAMKVLIAEVQANLAETLIPDIKLVEMNDTWYGVTPDGMKPLREVLDTYVPRGAHLRLRVLREEPN